MATAIIIAHNLEEDTFNMVDSRIRSRLEKLEKSEEEGNTKEAVSFVINGQTLHSPDIPGRSKSGGSGSSQGKGKKRKAGEDEPDHQNGPMEKKKKKSLRLELGDVQSAGESSSSQCVIPSLNSLRIGVDKSKSVKDYIIQFEAEWDLIHQQIPGYDEKMLAIGVKILKEFRQRTEEFLEFDVRGAYPQFFESLAAHFAEDSIYRDASKYLVMMWGHIKNAFSFHFLKKAVDAEKAFEGEDVVNDRETIISGFCLELERQRPFPDDSIFPYIAKVIGCYAPEDQGGVSAVEFLAALSKRRFDESKSREMKGIFVRVSKNNLGIEEATEEKVLQYKPASVDCTEAEWIYYPVMEED